MPRGRKKSLAVVGNTGIAAPSYVKESNQGKEAIRQSDLKMPVLKLGQEKSPAVLSHQVEIGQFFDNITKKQYGSEITIIPVLMITGQTMFGKYKQGEVNVLCQAPNGLIAKEAKGITAAGKPTNKCLECKNRLWEDNEPPACNENGRYLVLIPGNSMPLTLSLQRINFQAHRTIATYLQGSKFAAFAHTIKLEAHKNEKYAAWQILAVPQPVFASESDYLKAEALYKSLSKTFTSQSVEEEAE